MRHPTKAERIAAIRMDVSTPCAANVRRRHPDATECACTRYATRVAAVAGSDWEPEPMCEQHARQAEAGVNVFDPERPAVPR